MDMDVDMLEDGRFFSIEEQILTELGVDPSTVEGGSLKIEWLGGRVPVLTFKGSVPLNRLGDEGRAALSADIETWYNKPYINRPETVLPLVEESCDSGTECCGA